MTKWDETKLAEQQSQALELADRNKQRGWEHLVPGSDLYVDHPSHARPGIHAFPDKLYVVTMLENPLRFRTRYWNYWAFENMVQKAGAILYTAEIAFGGRAHEITEPGNPRHLQLRGHDELLHKENALNMLIARLPADWKYVAWIDSDVEFTRQDWAQETLQLLQHYKVLQMFSHSQDLGPNSEPCGTSQGYVSEMLKLSLDDQHGRMHHRHHHKRHHHHHHGHHHHHCGYPYYYYAHMPGKKFKFWHPGYCWAARRSAINQLGGLVDWAMEGSADYYMAMALFGQLHNLSLMNVPAASKPLYFEWERRAEKHIRRNVGMMPGLVLHHWHGRKADRQYVTRAKFLVKEKFNPLTDLKRDWQGIWQLQDHGTPHAIRVRDGLRYFARLRDEDSMELSR
jgi:hypothetical protein